MGKGKMPYNEAEAKIGYARLKQARQEAGYDVTNPGEFPPFEQLTEREKDYYMWLRLLLRAS